MKKKTTKKTASKKTKKAVTTKKKTTKKESPQKIVADFKEKILNTTWHHMQIETALKELLCDFADMVLKVRK